jgi:hypothetical protein
MNALIRLLTPLLALAFLGAAKKQPEITVRFHAEAKRLDGERFSSPVQLRHPPRQAYIERVPTISERHIKAIYPFEATDGTWGCAFQLDGSGRLALEVMSTDRRGSSLVPFMGTKLGAVQLVDMQIDKIVSDGLVSIPYGLTRMQVEALEKAFPIIGQPKKKR